MADKETAASFADDAETNSPGAALKRERKKQKKSLKDMCEEMHLDRWMLEAIERDDFAAIGAPVFAKGHLRQYAKALSVDPDELMVGYYQASGTREQPPLLADSVLHAEGHSERSFPWLWPLILALAVIAAIGVGIFLYLQPAEEPASVSGSRNELALTQPTVEEEVQTPQTEAEASVTEPIVVASNTTTQTQSVDNLLVDVAEAPEIASQADESSVGDERIVSNNVTVTLRFSGRSWVEVYDSKRQKLLYGLVESASAKYLSGPPPINVFLGRQNAVSVEVNGAPYTIPSTALRGNTARFQIDKPN